MNLRVMITGCEGQVGRELTTLLNDVGMDVKKFNRSELDIKNRRAVFDTLHHVKPNILVNCAAYTAVDKAEDEVELAMAINSDGPANLSAATSEIGIPIIQISTDYVFDGEKIGQYQEDDFTSPLGAYGKSKLLGEQLCAQFNPCHIILRTSWIFSKYGHNFVKTIARLSQEREELRIVADQIGCPTSAREIARAIYSIITKRVYGKEGIYHFCQPESVSWYEFACEIVSMARSLDYPVKCKNIVPIKTSEYPTSAKRPANSVLNCEKITNIFGLKIPNWEDSLKDVLMEGKNEESNHK